MAAIGYFKSFYTFPIHQYLKDDAINKAIQAGVHLPLAGHDQKVNKIMRITSMEKYISSGQLRFRSDWQESESYRELMDQLGNFPMPDYHDDGPDALQGCVGAITAGESITLDIIEI